MSDTTVKEILAALEFNEGKYEREAVEAAIAREEEIIPDLMAILEDLRADPARYLDDPRYFAHIYAVILLAYFKAEQAHRLIIDVFSMPEKFVSPLFEEVITEDLPMILYSTCGGSMEQIKELALNKEAYVFCRSSALGALNFAVVGGTISREQAIDFLGSLFTGDEAESGSEFWSLAANDVLDLYPEELMDVIKQAYEEELIWPGYIGLDSFKQTLAQGKEQTVAQLQANFQRSTIDDVHEHMSWWACFDQPQKSSAKSDAAKSAPVAGSSEIWPKQKGQSQPVTASSKLKNLGRNDPCWCGSGRKYKRCHWKSDRQRES